MNEQEHFTRVRNASIMDTDEAMRTSNRLRALGYGVITGCWAVSAGAIAKELQLYASTRDPKAVIAPHIIISEAGGIIREIGVWLPEDTMR